MAERGKPLDSCTAQRIRRLSAYWPLRKVAREVGVSRNTVRKVVRAKASV